MSQITISFVEEWIESQRESGVRVIRQLEKWLASEEDISLKSSTRSKVTVELQSARREKFVKELAERMTADFGESEPWAHVTFFGDLAGLDVPTGKKKTQDTESREEQPPAEEGQKPDKEQGDASQEEQRRGQPPAEEIQKSDKEQGDASQAELKGEQPPAEDVQKSDKKPDDNSQPELNPQETLEDICSQVPIKHSHELEAYVRETAAVIPVLQKMGNESTLWHQHLLMAMDAGYGRSKFLNALTKLYRAFGLVTGEDDGKSVREYILLPKGKEEESDGYRVTWDTVLNAAQEMKRSNTRNNSSTHNGNSMRNGSSKVVLYIDVSAWQTLLTTSEVKSHLRRLNSLCGTFLVVFRVPFLEGHVLRDTAEALNDILNVRTVTVPPAPIDDMIDYAYGKLATSGFQVADDALGAFEQWVLREKMDNSFFGYKTMDKVVQKVIYQKALSNCRHKVEDRVIGVNDLNGASMPDAEDQPVAELKKMVGMDEVERRLNEVIVQIKTLKEMAAQGKKVERPAIHMLFTGNPGTGKTTVARILARMMKQAGILRKGHLVEVKGRDLCGRFVGETAPKTSAICRDAYGSVLFIDEAYSLFRASDAYSVDYGREALDTLVAEMENHRDDFCVIMAGYKGEMDVMLKGNTGLKSRIPYEIEFPNYTRDELEKIFFTMLDGTFEYEDGLKEAVHEFFTNMPESTFKSNDFSNARLVRNLYERTWGKAAYRQSLEGGDNVYILKSDFVCATSDSEFKKLMKENERRAIGFGA